MVKLHTKQEKGEVRCDGVVVTIFLGMLFLLMIILYGGYVREQALVKELIAEQIIDSQREEINLLKKHTCSINIAESIDEYQTKQ
jgi:hypothetical protein